MIKLEFTNCRSSILSDRVGKKTKGNERNTIETIAEDPTLHAFHFHTIHTTEHTVEISLRVIVFSIGPQFQSSISKSSRCPASVSSKLLHHSSSKVFALFSSGLSPCSLDSPISIAVSSNTPPLVVPVLQTSCNSTVCMTASAFFLTLELATYRAFTCQNGQ